MEARIVHSAQGLSHGLDEGGSITHSSKKFFSPKGPHWLWGPPNLLFNGYWELFPRYKAANAWSWRVTSI